MMADSETIHIHGCTSSSEFQHVPTVVTTDQCAAVTAIDEIDNDLIDTDDSNNDKLPSEILAIIFKYLEHHGHHDLANVNNYVKALLTNRLVCKHWISAIDNTPALMRQLTFIIGDKYSSWELLSKSTLVNKVKSLKIIQPWETSNNQDHQDESGSSYYWFKQCFIHSGLAQSLQKLVLDFGIEPKPEPFSIEHCIQLNNCLFNTKDCVLGELHILTPALVNVLAEFWSSASSALKLKVFDTVHTLLLITTTSAENLQQIIARFPKLLKIEVKNFCIWDRSIYSALLDYVQVVSNGSLKEIILHSAFYQDSFEWYKFLFTILNRNIRIKTSNQPILLEAGNTVINFLAYQDTTANKQAPISEKTCQLFEFIVLEFYRPTARRPAIPIENLQRLGYCINTKKIQIRINRSVTRQELFFMQKLVGLEELDLTEAVGGFEDRNGPSLWGVILTGYGGPFHSITTLKICGDIFGFSLEEVTEVFSSLHLYFPALKALYLSTLRIIPGTIFVHLSRVEWLEEIVIHRMQLTDAMFTQVCAPASQQPQNGYQVEAGPLLMVPAINAFRTLKKLVLFEHVRGLTDLAILQGIGLHTNTTLTTLEIWDTHHRPFTITSEQALKNIGFELTSNRKRMQFIRNI